MGLSRILTRPRLVSVKRTGTEPSALFTTAQGKKYLNVNHSNDDTLIDDLIASATRIVEDRGSVALLTQTIETHYVTSLLPGLKVYRWPVASISSITTFDEGAGTALASPGDSFYVEGAGSRRGILREKEASTFAVDFTEVKIVCTCGFGAAASSVPTDLLQYVRQVLVYLYDHRDEFLQEKLEAHRIPHGILPI